MIKLIIIGFYYVFSNMLYHISLGLNKMLRYLLKSVGYKSKFIEYPKPKEDEDIIGI
tara:strand:+ start:267 stop:437 length:171 start_codon:yes stop_codon:yes gene_type:complete